jgi:hypothetical protein
LMEQSTAAIASSKIKLDVGGWKYTTSLATLSSEPQSMLAAMFSGRHELSVDSEGYHFIDRNGQYFGIILDWLRTKNLSSSMGADVIEILKREADFYQLTKLQSDLKKWKRKQTQVIGLTLTTLVLIHLQICKRFKAQNQDPVEQINKLLIHGYTVSQLTVNDGSIICVFNKPDEES